MNTGERLPQKGLWVENRTEKPYNTRKGRTEVRPLVGLLSCDRGISS